MSQTALHWLELFGGGGGVATGLEQAGHTVSTMIEIDPAIAECYSANHPETKVIVSDVRSVDLHVLPGGITALWASPVCKQHSQARQNSLEDREDADIGLAILPYVEYLKPRLVIIENVKRYALHSSCGKIVTALVRMGYTVSVRVLNAAEYGIPQYRERLVIQARYGAIAWPDQVAQHVSWYDAIKDITLEVAPLAPWQQRAWKSEYDQMVPLMVDSNYEFDTVRQLRIIPASQPAPTVLASHNARKHIVLQDGSTYKLTPQALARLQSFPDGYWLPTKKDVATEIIGNAVPPLLVQKLTENYKPVRSIVESECVA